MRRRRKMSASSIRLLFLLIGFGFLSLWQSRPELRSYFLHADESMMDPDQLERSAYYPNCAAARAAGMAPIYRGSRGYRAPLDADADGIACEPYRGRF